MRVVKLKLLWIHLIGHELIFLIFLKSKKDCLLISQLLSDHKNFDLIKSFSIIGETYYVPYINNLDSQCIDDGTK